MIVIRRDVKHLLKGPLKEGTLSLLCYPLTVETTPPSARTWLTEQGLNCWAPNMSAASID